MTAAAALTGSPLRPEAEGQLARVEGAESRGRIHAHSRMMASGRVRATSSMSMPPAADAMQRRQPRSAIDHDPEVQLLAGWPSPLPPGHAAPVAPRGRSDASGASSRGSERRRRSAASGVCAGLTPPPLPRPPAWIWAFTTTGPPSSWAMRPGLGGSRSHPPAGDRNAELRQDRFRLILVDFHARSILVVGRAPLIRPAAASACAASCPAPRTRWIP